jgi:small subunit ribosomal protein S6
MNLYEFVFITKSEDKSLLKKTEKLITDFGGTIAKQDNWGKRTFAYKMKGLTEGYYFVWDLSLNAKTIKEFKNKLNLEEDVLRYLVIKKS